MSKGVEGTVPGGRVSIIPQPAKLCVRCHAAPRNGSRSSYCVSCSKIIDRENNTRRPLRTNCARCGKIRTGRHHTYCASCIRMQRVEWLDRNRTTTKPCARCKEAPRLAHMSYCRPCHRALGAESRARTGGKKPQENCSRCGNKRDGRHPTYCNTCNKIYKQERLLGPCSRCGKKRTEDDHTNSSYCYNCWRGWWLKRKYGLTAVQFEDLLIIQGNRCAICRAEANGRTWHVDHCHKTGRVRGILCDTCNRAIGNLHDDPALLRRAANYLETSSDSEWKIL